MNFNIKTLASITLNTVSLTVFNSLGVIFLELQYCCVIVLGFKFLTEMAKIS